MDRVRDHPNRVIMPSLSAYVRADRPATTHHPTPHAGCRRSGRGEGWAAAGEPGVPARSPCDAPQAGFTAGGPPCDDRSVPSRGLQAGPGRRGGPRSPALSSGTVETAPPPPAAKSAGGPRCDRPGCPLIIFLNRRCMQTGTCDVWTYVAAIRGRDLLGVRPGKRSTTILNVGRRYPSVTSADRYMICDSDAAGRPGKMGRARRSRD